MAILLVSIILNTMFYTLHILNNSKIIDKYYLKFMLQKTCTHILKFNLLM